MDEVGDAIRLTAALGRVKEDWLWRHGSADAQTRGGYIEGIQDAVDVIEEYFEGQEQE